MCGLKLNQEKLKSPTTREFTQPFALASYMTGKSQLSSLCDTDKKVSFSSVQSLSRVQLFATAWTAAHQASLSITNYQSSPKPMSIESVMPSSHLILCRPLLLLPSIFPSIRVFSNESALCIRWLKYWSFSFNISPSNEHPGLISFRMDWLDLLAAQETLKSVLQHHSSKVSIIWHSAFFRFFYFSYQYVRAHTVVFPPTSRLSLPVFQQRLTLTPGLQQEFLTLERACHLFPQTPGRNEVDNLVF